MSDQSSSPSSMGQLSPELQAIGSLIQEGVPPKVILNHIAPSFRIPPDADDIAIWRILCSLIEPQPRNRLTQYNKLEDAIDLIHKSRNIIVLSGAGISTSAGLPDFRSRDGIYVKIHAEHPDLQDPKYMFDINYFRHNPLPFYQFARALYPGQYEPTIGHKFIKCLEDHDKLLRNYSQNIDTLERQAGIRNIVECHGSFARATCTECGYSVDGDDIKSDIFEQRVPLCPECKEKSTLDDNKIGLMKPNIVFFGEQLGENFHRSLELDKDEADLLIVIGSSLRVRPVSLIPKSIPPNVPQILINKEPLDHMNFDIELLGNCDEIIQEICLRLGNSWDSVCKKTTTRLREIIGLPCISESSQESTSNTDTCAKEANAKSDDTQVKSIMDAKPNMESMIDDEAGDIRNEPDGSSKKRKEHQVGDEKVAPPSDDDGDWEDVEIVHSTDEAEMASLKAKFDVPDGSYIYLRPNVYLFHGAELTNSQLCQYTEKQDV